MKKLNEFFALPTGTSIRGYLDDTKLYGSSDLDQKFLLCVQKNVLSAPVSNIVQKLMQKRVIIPCYLNSGFLSFFYRKVFNPHPQSDTLGFFSSTHLKIYILVDNRSNIFGLTDEEGLVRTLLHELIHLCAFKKKNLFMKMFEKDLTQFYGFFLTHYFELNEYASPKDSKEFYTFLLNDYELTKSTTINLKKFYEKINKLFNRKTSLDSEKFDERAKLYVFAIYSLETNFEKIRAYYNSAFRQVHLTFRAAYKEVFNFNVYDTFVIQEVARPSEVICLIPNYAQKDSLEKIYSFIRRSL